MDIETLIYEFHLRDDGFCLVGTRNRAQLVFPQIITPKVNVRHVQPRKQTTSTADYDPI